MQREDPHQQAVQHASRGDRVAVDVLLERHLPALQTYVRLHTRDVVHQRESCEDLCQSVCREVLEHLDGFEYRGEAEFRHWLFTTVRSKLIDRLRYWRAGRRDYAREQPVAPRQDRSEADQSRFDDLRARLPTPSQHAIAREDIARFEAAFVQLPQEQQEVLTLNRLMGFSHRQIAARLGISEAASRQLLHRTLVRLATLLEQQRQSESSAGG